MTDSTIIVTTYAFVGALSWLIIGIGACLAIYSPQVKDTFMERVWLSLVCLTSWGTTIRIMDRGFLSTEFTFASIVIAGYVITVTIKKIKKAKECSLQSQSSKQVPELH